MKTKSCLVADLLGFRQMIQNLDQDRQRERVEKWAGIISTALDKHHAEHHLLVSDTLMVVCENTSRGVETLIDLSRELLENGIEESFLVRGAIACGEVAWEPGVIFGKAISSAYEFGNLANWIGISMHSSTESNAKGLFKKDRLVRYPVPLKSGPALASPCVCWSVPEPYRLIGNSIANGLTPDTYIVQSTWAEKIENTLLFSAYNKLLSREDGGDPSEFEVNAPIAFAYIYKKLLARNII
jgi:hypothetical protein